MITTSQMALKVWNLLTDLFDHDQLADNWAAIDAHDHTPAKGVQVPTGGIADGAVTTSKLATNAVTLAQLDPSVRPLVITNVVTSDYAAAAGDFVVAGHSAPITITLPPPVKDAVVGVFAVAPVTSTNKLTVRNHNTEVLFGPGFNNATSIVLGSVAAYVVFQSDGTNWLLRSGAQDTGWVPLIGGGGTAAGYYPQSARKIADWVYLRGGGVGAACTAVPSGMAPASQVTLPLIPGGANQVQIAASTGSLTLPGAAPWLWDGLSYSLT